MRTLLLALLVHHTQPLTHFTCGPRKDLCPQKFLLEREIITGALHCAGLLGPPKRKLKLQTARPGREESNLYCAAVRNAERRTLPARRNTPNYD